MAAAGLFAIARPVNEAPATFASIVAVVLAIGVPLFPPAHAEIEPSIFAKMKLALCDGPPFGPTTGKSVAIVVIPGAAGVTCPVGPFAAEAGASFWFRMFTINDKGLPLPL